MHVLQSFFLIVAANAACKYLFNFEIVHQECTLCSWVVYGSVEWIFFTDTCTC